MDTWAYVVIVWILIGVAVDRISSPAQDIPRCKKMPLWIRALLIVGWPFIVF